MEDKITMVIDCDAGIDDAVAIMMALADPRVNLIGITCVNGNVPVPQVTRNVLRVLQKCKRLDIPVYSGASRDMLGTYPVENLPDYDGLGDFPNPNPLCTEEHVQTEHAVDALIRLANERKGEVTLVAIGPLTNVALAIRLDPGFSSKLKELVIMGGNIGSRSVTGPNFPVSEFNFRVDPTSAHVVLQESECDTKLIPIETCNTHCITFNWFDNLPQSEKAKFVAAMFADRLKQSKTEGRSSFRVADGCAMVVALCRDAIKRSVATPCKVEHNEGMTKGQLVTTTLFRHWAKSFQGPGINVVMEFDMEAYYRLLNQAVQE